MPLALQALLPFIALLGAAAIVRQRPRRQGNGWIAAGATVLAAIIALVELLRLSPGEHVDVPYLTTFPYADLAIRLDGLSLAFASITLLPAAMLMLVRQRMRGDRRDPRAAWWLTRAAPAASLRLRLVDLMGGGLRDRTTAVVLSSIGVIGALVLAAIAISERAVSRVAGLLLAAQAGLALALSTGDQALMTVASTWLWLLLVPLAGLAGVRPRDGSGPEALTLLSLAMLPGSLAFVGLWLGGLALNARGLLFAMIPVGLVVVASVIAALGHVTVRRPRDLDVAAAWAGALVLVAAFPIVAIGPVVVPAAATVRLVPRGMSSVSPFGLATAFGAWPALPLSLVFAFVFGLAGWRLHGRLPLRPRRAGVGRAYPSLL